MYAWFAQDETAAACRGGTTEKEKDLFSLLYTFLAQMSHREDYRKRLSEMYAGWRAHLVEDITATVPEPRMLSPHITACLFQALIHGLTMQLAVDPEAFDRDEMIAACSQILAPLFPVPLSARGDERTAP